MASNYIVKAGDCLSSITEQFGFHDWHTIYDHPNNADFRAKRPDPNIIYPGDELFIPDLELRQEDGRATDRKHSFVASVPSTYLNLKLQDAAQRPLSNVPYKLLLSSLEMTGNSDGQGWLRQRIPASAEFGTLLLWPESADPAAILSLQVLLGHLDPLDTASGVKARLNNLGYLCGAVNDEKDAAYDAAVRQFQQECGLVVDGIVGPKTRAKLKANHLV